ncbi:MAG: LytR/AlgR family response regulator transcription factor [Eubacterium sp.]
MIKIVICDDSKEFLEILKYKVNQCVQNSFEMECDIACFDNLKEFNDYIKFNKIDIVILDIMINDTNAMDWSIDHFKNKYTQIIFITSYPQCAYNISESNCCYYLLKSKVDNNSLTKALHRAFQKTVKKDPNLTIVKQGNKNYTIDYNDIIYIETFNNDITLHLKDQEDLTIYVALKEYAKNLPPNFLRCHKCYMINMNYVASYQPHKFTLKTGESIPIPPKKYKVVTNIYRNYLKNI